MRARLALASGAVEVDLGAPISLVRPVSFETGAPTHFGAPPPQSVPLAVPGFAGTVIEGASCNCRTLTLTPHCHGTHTECVGHLTREPLDAWRVIPETPLLAWLASVEPLAAERTAESSDPRPQRGDVLITRARLAHSWPRAAASGARALVIRSDTAAASRPPPYLSREAAEWIVARGIEHLLVELPSVDRVADEGRLTAHRIFFGLPPGERALALAARAHATITELACVPEGVPDGAYLLALQAPAIAGDAVPSRPLLYRLAGESAPAAHAGASA